MIGNCSWVWAVDRIVSLSPVATELITALQVQNRLVGVTDICDYQGSGKIERLGAYSAVSAEAVYNLKPDLVVLTEGAENQSQMFRGLGLKVSELKTSSLLKFKTSARELAKVLGREKELENLFLERDKKIDSLKFIEKDGSSRPRLLIVFGEDGSHFSSPSFYGIGRNTFYEDLILSLGGMNELEQDGYNVMSMEGICSTQASCIIFSTDNMNDENILRLKACQQGSKIRTVPKKPFLHPGIKYADIAASIASCFSN